MATWPNIIKCLFVHCGEDTISPKVKSEPTGFIKPEHVLWGLEFV